MDDTDGLEAPSADNVGSGFRGIAFYFALMVIAVVSIYVTTNLKYHIENYLYDLTTRIKPDFESPDRLTLVPLAGGPVVGEYEKLSLALERLSKRQEVKQIVVYLWENFFPFEHPLAERVVAQIAADPRVVVGVLGFVRLTPSALELPPVLRSIEDRVFGMDTMKERSNSVVRLMPFTGFRGDSRTLLLATRLAMPDAKPESFFASNTSAEIYDHAPNSGWYLLNYRPLADFHKVGLQTLLQDDPHLNDVVILTHLDFKEWVRQTRDQVFVNTPYKGDRNTYRAGQSLGYVYSVAIENLLLGNWLHPVRRPLSIALTVFLTLLFGLIWRTGTTNAIVTIVFSWAVIIFGHGLVASLAHHYIPLSDIFLYSSLSMIGGALWQMNREIRLRAEIEAETKARVEIARIQSRFLDSFSYQMLGLNDQLATSLTEMEKSSLTATSNKLLDKTMESCADFSNFLSGIKQVAALDRGHVRKPSKVKVPVGPMISSVVRQFESRIAENKLTVEIDCAKELHSKTDPNLVEPIIFNLVSNAVKYSRQGGKVSINCFAEGTSTIVDVRDEGPGIKAEHREKIFEKFYRVKDDSVYKVSGTGLGLYLCRYFAGQIGAKIELVESSEKGSLFRLTL